MITKKKINKNIKEIQREIDHYRVPTKMADIMLRLGEAGFEFGGHGTAYTGEEDFSFDQKISSTLSITVTTNRKKILSIDLSDGDDVIILNMKDLDKMVSVLFNVEELI